MTVRMRMSRACCSGSITAPLRSSADAASLPRKDYAEAEADGVHITRESHLRLAQAIAEKTKELFAD